ncbi:DEAD/DEAH box helicase [Natronospira bacteriovora]|uniref:ATP-dependent RNA helicase RhlE n=1 Tax=Natronospira bacteriovora TaxID=3069753 RepID=A0ABU0W6Q9_9GAMM|nr:DEAD/DEAH box helicase [Natronospira sp. AB-CW4]MDQ2068685.1 DEAD/DEAH box helicase [Natronospira sp. AB-CW4]
MNFSDFGLSAALTRAIQEQGYDTPTPVQAQAIPAILAGGDVMAAAQTGTGKTAGFTLPLLERLMAEPPKGGRRTVRALILTPTRELAAQVQQSVHTYGKHLPLKSATIYGGVGMNPQIQTLRRGVDILVATPGRLLDHLRQGNADLSRVETLILDEADRMLDMGFIHDIRQIIRTLPEQRQTLLFSATFSSEIRKLAGGMLKTPTQIEVAARNTAAERVEQRVHPVSRGDKRAVLSHLISDGNWRQVLVFTRTKHGADRLVKQLDEDGLSAVAIHGNKTQAARGRALRQFKQGSVRILVATDIAARGIDIDHLPHVVNFELPNVPEDYVHRIGRTGRAGREGVAVSLVCVDENKLLHGIEKLLGNRIESQVVEGFEPDPSERPQPIFKKPGARRRPGGHRHNDNKSERPKHARSRKPRPAGGNRKRRPSASARPSRKS